MEKWLKDAKKKAKLQAEIIVSDISDIADDLQVEKWWFFEEVIKHVHKMKDEESKR